ncbi:MAG: hydroxymethylglutaryl-CoA synthase [Myxococcota bacterium]
MQSQLGISGFALYVPSRRVSLQNWCTWTGNSWSKVEAVVGRGFRMKGPDENVYTLAATAVLRLIESYDLNPERIGMLALGTESSTDNAVGAVIVRGMVDHALEASGRARLSRNLEVPEIKHACLGGVYALKGALRYLNTDGAGRQAIVVAADVAEYARGSTGEPTQGAGAVAMLVEAAPRLLAIDVASSVSASAYRGPDFRKPTLRFFDADYSPGIERLHDFPVFNGKYSTACYFDEVIAALRTVVDNQDAPGLSWLDSFARVFFHRPYARLPSQAWGMAVLYALSRDPRGQDILASCAKDSGVAVEAVVAEFERPTDLFTSSGPEGLADTPFPAATAALKAFTRSEHYPRLVAQKLELGADSMAELGNLYTGALFAWLASGFAEAQGRRIDLTNERWLLTGYGSGDASEILSAEVVPDYHKAASRIGFAETLTDSIVLSQEQYERLHDRGDCDVDIGQRRRFFVDRVGKSGSDPFDEVGIEYYRLAK